MRSVVLLSSVLLLSGCNWVMNVSGLNKDAHKAIGASCRQTGRSLEECFKRNPEADRAQVFNGWKEMNEYMVKNNLHVMLPPVETPPPEDTKSKKKDKEKADDKASSHDTSASAADQAPDPAFESVLKSIGNPDKHSSSHGSKAEQEVDRVLSIINGPNGGGGGDKGNTNTHS